MKKQNLKLNRQTIRQLSGAELSQQRGGVDTNPNTLIPLQCAQTSAGCSVLICVDTYGSRCTGQATFTC